MLQWLSDFFKNIVNMLLSPIKTLLIYPFMSMVIKVIGSALYTFMCMPFYLFIDFLNMFFRRICGLEGHVNFGSDPSTGLGTPIGEGEDLVMAFITSKPVMDVFISLSLIAVVLLFISTIIAIIKTEYTFDKAGNSKAPIFARAIKAVVLYLTIPAACVLGIYFSNMMLKAIDQATKPGGNTTISGMLFKSSCQRANRVNTSQSFALLYSGAPMVNVKWYFNAGQSVQNGTIVGSPNNENKPFKLLLELGEQGGSGTDALDDIKPYEAGINYAEADKLAELINTAFATGYNENKNYYNSQVLSGKGYISRQAAAVAKIYGRDPGAKNLAIDGAAHLFSVTGMVKAGFSVYNLELLNFYYDLFSLDYLQVIVVGLILAKTLGGITIGVAKRLYEMVVLFVISPPVVALMPLDEGQAYKTWAKEFISRVFSLYGGVLAMNFFFMISPMVCQINFFPDVKTGDNPAALSSFLSYMPSLIFITAGALSISSISKMLSGIIGSKDSLSEGTEMMGQVASSIGGAASFAGGVGSMIGKGFKGGFKGVKAGFNKAKGAATDAALGKDYEKAAATEGDAQEGAAANTAGAPAGGSPIAGARAGGGAGGAGGAQAEKAGIKVSKASLINATQKKDVEKLNRLNNNGRTGKLNGFLKKVYEKKVDNNAKIASGEKTGFTGKIKSAKLRAKSIIGTTKNVLSAGKKAITPALKGASQLGKMIGGTLLGAVGGGEFGKAFKEGSYGKMKQSEKEEKEKKAAKEEKAEEQAYKKEMMELQRSIARGGNGSGGSSGGGSSSGDGSAIEQKISDYNNTIEAAQNEVAKRDFIKQNEKDGGKSMDEASTEAYKENRIRRNKEKAKKRQELQMTKEKLEKKKKEEASKKYQKKWKDEVDNGSEFGE